MYKKLIFIFLLSGIISGAWSQEGSPLKREYQHGKEMYQEGRYEMAMEILKPLTLPANESAYSPYAGYFEKVADRISAVLTPETRQAILTIKNTVPDTLKVMGIQVYKAVIADGIRDTDSFLHWMSRQPDEGIITWMP